MAEIASVMACMRSEARNDELLAIVRDLAQRFSASVVGVAVRQPSSPAAFVAIAPSEPRSRDLDEFRERASAMEAEFRAALRSVADLQWRSQVTAGPLSQFIANEARGVDLIVASADAADHLFFPSHDVEVSDLLMRAGRPLLIAPPSVSGLKLTQSLVCWKESREARRAIADALPLLKASKAVEVVELAREHEMEAARRRIADIGDWLARHGVDANCVVAPLTGLEAPQLGAIARDLNADLIVAGAFGHSRLREWAFGGVTRDLLLKADRCTLVSH